MGQHDDLVLALCLALWDASRSGGLTPNPALSSTWGESIAPEELEALPYWFWQAPGGERLGACLDDTAPPIERDKPRDLSIDRGYPFY